MEEKNKAETKCAVITNKYSQRKLSNKQERRINPKPNYYISSFEFRKIVNLIVLSTSVHFWIKSFHLLFLSPRTLNQKNK